MRPRRPSWRYSVSCAPIAFPNLPERSQLQSQYVGVGVRTDNIMVGCYSEEGKKPSPADWITAKRYIKGYRLGLYTMALAGGAILGACIGSLVFLFE